MVEKFQMKSESFVGGSKHGTKTIDEQGIITTFV